jgi:hypothetical protein
VIRRCGVFVDAPLFACIDQPLVPCCGDAARASTAAVSADVPRAALGKPSALQQHLGAPSWILVCLWVELLGAGVGC